MAQTEWFQVNYLANKPVFLQVDPMALKDARDVKDPTHTNLQGQLIDIYLQGFWYQHGRYLMQFVFWRNLKWTQLAGPPSEAARNGSILHLLSDDELDCCGLRNCSVCSDGYHERCQHDCVIAARYAG